MIAPNQVNSVGKQQAAVDNAVGNDLNNQQKAVDATVANVGKQQAAVDASVAKDAQNQQKAVDSTVANVGKQQAAVDKAVGNDVANQVNNIQMHSLCHIACSPLPMMRQ